MRVLVVGPSPTRSKGGMATVIEEIAKDKRLNEECDIEIYESYIDGNKLKVLVFSVFSFIRFYFTKRDYDIYHIHAASYGSTFRKGWYVRAAKKWGKKVILHIHGAEYMIFFEKSHQKMKIISILNAADKVIALSEEWKHRFEETFGIKNCFAIENGIDMERLAPAITDNREHPHTFVSLGRLGERKGTYDLIAAIELVRNKIPDIKCYLAGDGEIEKCKELIKEKKLEGNIIIVGWADFDKKLELLKKSSVVVLPSYNEGLPMSILEGMACGKAIISTTVGAIPEVVKEENGILVEPGDVKALVEAIKKCCNEQENCQHMSEANMRLIQEDYEVGVMHKKLEKIYDCLVGGVKQWIKDLRSICVGIGYDISWELSRNRKNNDCLNKLKRDEEIIVSLTSFPGRINIVHKTIRSILNQENVKPDRVELWLAKEQFENGERDLPRPLLELKKAGLEICWCDDLRSFKKLIPALKKHPSSVIVTTDDDVYYERRWLEKLVTAYEKDKNNIYCHKVTKFYIDNNGDYQAMGGGKYYYKEPSFLNKLVGVGGVLYPPKSLSEKVFNVESFQKLAPTNDDIWFWLMAVVNGTKIKAVDRGTPKPIEIYETKKSSKLTKINDHGENLFWVQLRKLINEYPDIDTMLRSEWKNRKNKD